MAYRLNRRLFIENGAAVTAADALSRTSASAFRAWRGLNSDGRLEAVERALNSPANDGGELPIAL